MKKKIRLLLFKKKKHLQENLDYLNSNAYSMHNCKFDPGSVDVFKNILTDLIVVDADGNKKEYVL